jgi:hypothetical protein
VCTDNDCHQVMTEMSVQFGLHDRTCQMPAETVRRPLCSCEAFESVDKNFFVLQYNRRRSY